MGKGIYLRTQAHRDAIRKARLGAKASPEAKKNQGIAARKTALSPEWRKRVSEGTRKKMRLPSIRRKHLAGLRRARRRYGVNFRNGNGQILQGFVLSFWKVLKPLGYIREYAIGVSNEFGRKHGGNYKVDFGLPSVKIAIECDGPSHRSFAQQEKDRKKDAVLHRLGWRVIRVPHE